MMTIVNGRTLWPSSLGYRNEGWFDPWTLLNAFKKKALSMGVHYIQGEVVGADVQSTVRSVQVKHMYELDFIEILLKSLSFVCDCTF